MTTAQILVVEREKDLALVVGAALRLADFTVAEAATGTAALRLARERRVDLLVLDVALDDMDSFDVCRELRASGSDAPVVFLTERDEPHERLRGLTIGGGDHLTKPFSLEELVVTVRAVLQRAGRDMGGQVYRCGDVSLDDVAHRVTVGGATIELSPTEYKLLRFLLRNAGRVLTRGQILDHVWDYDFDGESTVVETFMSTLRKKLAESGPHLIQTVRGVGYRMSKP